MSEMKQFPACGEYLLRWKGDQLEVRLETDPSRAGCAVFRTDVGNAAIKRDEVIALTDNAETPLEKAWHDVPMTEEAPGKWICRIPLDETGVFSGKCCFFPKGSSSPEWPEGGNLGIKVEPSFTRRGNSIYTVFPRQFGSFREVARRLDFIMGEMDFNIIQTLPVFPVPVTYAVMGEYGCPFAATDFFSVDPAMAEFDERATPLDQFRELIGAVHARGGRLFVDLPANHTGWASALQTHHPEWFRRHDDGRFASPGAWGVVWADLVELDYSHPGLRSYMADVFLFWVRNGVDGFRCDAGYMIPAETWRYIVARVRAEYPDTVFMLEGLGGKLEVTDQLLNDSGLDWAYSEIFQTYDRGAFEWYLPDAVKRAEKYGTLVHFAETHDNDRLAKGGREWARLRVQLAALLSHQGAWGIANGVEWYATEKIDVHGANSLNWGASENMVPLIARLNGIISSHPSFAEDSRLSLVTRGEGNTLAVLREGGGENLLVIANLGCGDSATVRWDASRFPCHEAFDLVGGKSISLDPESGIWLDRGEVMCLAALPRAELPVQGAEKAPEEPAASVRWNWPEDVCREVCVPSGCSLYVTAPHPFRVRLVAGERTLAVERSCGNAAVVVPPSYTGDGSSSNRIRIVVSVYAPDGVKRDSGTVVIPPPIRLAKAKSVYSGDEIRRSPSLETILGNGAGAAARVKLAWGEVLSRYDSLFAANTDPNVPSDRLTLWTRCRAWLQHDGYSREFNRDVIESFTGDPAGRFAQWIFRVPCGMGMAVRFSFTLSLAEGQNAARLAVRRLKSDVAEPAGDVRIVFRPDLEWRSFHSVTKAMGDVERAFGAHDALHSRRGGFDFHPYSGKTLKFSVNEGEFHPDAEWTYCVHRPEEAERGQDSNGDLFSPGWISCDFEKGGESSLVAAYGRVVEPVFASAPSETKTFADALAAAMKLFIVKRDDVKTVLAGYPWFLDWGRDTFIFLRGAIAAGYTKEALDIAVAFGRFERNGTLPNIIYGGKAGNRDTVDAQLWFIAALKDLVDVLGVAVLSSDCTPPGEVWTRTLSDVVVSICEHYVDGTTNGIAMDPESALIRAPSHFTWMDTNYPACTPREGYAVEIQALWIAALRFLGRKDFPRLLAKGRARWNALADRAAESLVKYFRHPSGEGLVDCLDAGEGVPAAKAVPDCAVRPNQIFVVSLGAVPASSELASSIVRACSRLVVPGGMRSLADNGDVRYRGIYTGEEDSSRKPAYHNGPVWAWPFASYVQAACKCGMLSRGAALSLLASAVDSLNSGCVCQMPEIADGDAPHAQKGCRAQAWSVSELFRVLDCL